MILVRILISYCQAVEDGKWQVTLAHILGTKYAHELYRFRILISEKKWPACSLTYYKNGKELRIIQALKDDPDWVFFEKGEPLEIESISYYRKRRIKYRFNETVLVEYAERLGWNLQEEKNWQPNKVAFLINR